MCPIIWSSFTWEAFATLFTGVAAVIGAVWIWFRQQTILGRQVELEELKLRSELFEKRFAVYEDTRTWFGHMIREGREPIHENMWTFVAAIDRASFLFGPAVAVALEDARRKATQHSVYRAEGKHQEAGAVFLELTEVLRNLKGIFGLEMHLSRLDDPATEAPKPTSNV